MKDDEKKKNMFLFHFEKKNFFGALITYSRSGAAKLHAMTPCRFFRSASKVSKKNTGTWTTYLQHNKYMWMHLLLGHKILFPIGALVYRLSDYVSFPISLFEYDE